MIWVNKYSFYQDKDVLIVMLKVMMMLTMLTMLIPFTSKCNYGKYGSIDDLKNMESHGGVHIFLTMELFMKMYL